MEYLGASHLSNGFSNLGHIRSEPGQFYTSSLSDVLLRLNMTCTSFLFQHVAFGLHLPFTNFNNLVAESGRNLFERLVPSLTVCAVSKSCLFVDLALG